MAEEPTDTGDEAQRVADATAFLEQRNVPPNAREFRLRQEFFRHTWDVRVRDDGGSWSVRAVKQGRPDVAEQGTSEGTALRLALAAAIAFDETAAS